MFDKYEAVIVDIDGTVADKNGRGIHDYHLVGLDDRHQDVIDLVQALESRRDVAFIFLTGRPERCRRETMMWLSDTGMRVDALYMRPDNDRRKDFVVKKEIYDKLIAPHYDVWFALEDRDRVVKMWRENGIRCLQVVDGNF